MRYLLTIFSLCVALATSARAQTPPISIEIDAQSSPVQGDLIFNPTASGSPYPFRSIPSNPPAQPSVDVQCFNTNNTQGLIPTPDSTQRAPVDPACFKSFPQFFKPLESVLNNDNTYVLRVCNLQNAPSRFRVSVIFTVPTPTNTQFPADQLVYRLINVGNSSTTGNWTNAQTTAATLYTSTTLNQLPAVTSTPAGSNCTTLTVQLRLRLDGGESFLNTSAPLSSDVTFSVAVFP